MSIQQDETVLDEIRTIIQDALEVAREEDEPRDMEIRFLLSIALEKLESFRYDLHREI
tara:strand:+ start:197 stop:370 length:174 start_codon:yes stop_codon:yes gene_type:complete